VITVLFDTSVLSEWHDDRPATRPRLEMFFLELGRHGAQVAQFVSAVTEQEMLNWGYLQGRGTDVEQFLTERFNALAFDRATARHAASLQAWRGRPERQRPKAADRAAVDAWFRDAAIVATAIQHNISYLATFDEGIKGFQPRYRGTIRVL
jgi:predicted nucleic acid-binding protein